MFPFLDLKFFRIPMYGFCILTGIVLSSVIAFLFIKRDRKNIYDFIIMGAMCFGFAFAGAKCLYVFVSYPVSVWGNVFLSLFTGSGLLESGFVFYGGLIGGAIGFFAGALIARCNPLEYTDYAAFMIPLSHGFGRIGCACAGCCYGMPYQGPLALYYTHPLSSAPVGEGCFPVQFMEAVMLFVLAALIIFLAVKKKHHLIYIYFFIYPLIRFTTEFFRADAERGFLGMLSTSQVISLGIFALGLVVLFVSLGVKARQKNLKIK